MEHQKGGVMSFAAVELSVSEIQPQLSVHERQLFKSGFHLPDNHLPSPIDT